MRKIFYTAILFTLHFCVVQAQTTFQKMASAPNINGVMASHNRTKDGGYLFTGTTTDNNTDFFVLKTDSMGVVQWSNAYGGYQMDGGYGINTTQDGGSIVCGLTSSDSIIGNRALLLKLDSLGNIQWSKSYGWDYEWANAVVQTKDKGYLAVGATGTQSSSVHMWYFKTDSLGNLQWNKKISGYGCCGYGGSMTAVIETKDQNYLLAGNEYCYYCSASAIYYTKINILDTVIWSGSFVGAQSPYAQNLEQTHDNGFMITGAFGSGVYLLKIDSAGAYKWMKNYSGLYDAGTAVKQTNDNGYVIAGNGYPAKNLFLHKTDSSGNLIWSKAYGDTSKFTADPKQIFINHDNGYTIAGGFSNKGGGKIGAYLTRVDNMGVGYCSEFSVLATASLPNGAFGGIFYNDTLGGCRSVTLSQYSLLISDTTLCEHILGSNNILPSQFSVFPNPFSESTVIHTGGENETMYVELFNSMGQRLKVYDGIRGSEFVLRRDGLPTGMYVIKLLENKVVLAVKKVIITD